MEPDIQPVSIKINRECLTCSYMAPDIHKIRHHYNSTYCMSLNFRKWICPSCSMNYIEKLDLDNHMLNIHYETCLQYVSNFFYECDNCDFRDVRKEHVLQHVKNSIRQDSFQCYNCDEVFNSKKDLVDHFTTHPLAPDTYCQCLDCITFFTTSKFDYDLHVIQTPVCSAKDLRYVTHGSEYLRLPN